MQLPLLKRFARAVDASGGAFLFFLLETLRLVVAQCGLRIAKGSFSMRCRMPHLPGERSVFNASLNRFMCAEQKLRLFYFYFIFHLPKTFSLEARRCNGQHLENREGNGDTDPTVSSAGRLQSTAWSPRPRAGRAAVLYTNNWKLFFVFFSLFSGTQEGRWWRWALHGSWCVLCAGVQYLGVLWAPRAVLWVVLASTS